MRITNLKPLISEEAIQTRVKEMAGEISTLYKDEPLVVVCVLKGAFMFFSDLVRHLTCKPELDFVRLASYGSAAQRSKTITFTKEPAACGSGRQERAARGARHFSLRRVYLA